MTHLPVEEDGILPANVTPIRQDMMFQFESNTPIAGGSSQERIECSRYQLGYCRSCESPRGSLTPWCSDHYPWKDGLWTPLIVPGEERTK